MTALIVTYCLNFLKHQAILTFESTHSHATTQRAQKLRARSVLLII